MPDGAHAKNVEKAKSNRCKTVNPVTLLFTACLPRLSSNNHSNACRTYRVTHIGTIWPPTTAQVCRFGRNSDSLDGHRFSISA
jgi:hypothetical protein